MASQGQTLTLIVAGRPPTSKSKWGTNQIRLTFLVTVPGRTLTSHDKEDGIHS